MKHSSILLRVADQSDDATLAGINPMKKGIPKTHLQETH
jgi:hypothetical protein